MKRTKKPVDPASAAPANQFANPQAIIEHIEAKSTGLPPDDPYRTRVEEIMGLLLPQQGDPDTVADAEHIRETSAGLAIETAARLTGFIIGFEYCRDLILARGGAR
jgi:hypothetical protein